MFSDRIVARGRRKGPGGRECGGTLIEEVLARGEGKDRIGSLENAVSKWRQPTWRFVVKHQHCHKSQWRTSDVSDHVGNIRNNSSSDTCPKFTDRAVGGENRGTPGRESCSVTPKT